MQVILQKDVKNLGQAGETVSVKNGYARYFLLPKKLALPYTKAGAKEMAHRKLWIAARQKKALLLRQSQIEKLQNVEISFTREADASGHLFGSVAAGDIIKELEKQGHEVPKKWITLDRPIKNTGDHKLIVQSDNQNSAEIQIHIIAKKPDKKTSDKDDKKTDDKKTDTDPVKTLSAKEQNSKE